MEIHFQQPEQEFAIPVSKMSNKFKGRSRSSGQNNKYVGVRQRPSGRWVAEIKDTTQKIRMWLGTFETAEEAARAYDEAACLLRGSNTRTNFVPQQISPDSPLASRIKNLLNKRKNAKVPQSNTDLHESSGATPSPANSVSVNNCIASSSNGAPSSPACSSGEYDSSSIDSVISFEQKTPEGHLFDDAYKPDLSNCCAKGFEMEMGPSYHDQTHMPSSGLQAQCFDHRFAFSTTQDHHQLLQLPKLNESGLPEIANHHMVLSEFERMKVERQISASLYAMNGVQEYMETVLDPIEALWDLPPLCSLLC